MVGRKICLCCGTLKGIKQFGTHHTTPDGRRYECRICRWEERWNRQKAWSAKHMPDGGTRKDMRKEMGFRQPEKTPKVWEYWWRSYADLGFEKRSFGSINTLFKQ